MLPDPIARQIGVVVIGRNEGERLVRGLQALRALGARTLYVDSASSDGSVQRVREQFPGMQVLELSTDKPLSAARGRNEGALAWRAQPDPPRYLQFVDGDCVMLPGWLDAASGYLEAHPDCSAVVGPLQEMHPEASVYNQLCALEWKSAVGDIEDCGSFGGISMVRASVFEALGGFNPRIIAGEDPEFAVRMKLAGHRITKLPVAMAQHDAGMTKFSEFWKRSVRSGHAIGHRYDLHGRGPQKDCAKDLRSVKIWGLGLPAAALVAGALTGGWGLLLWPLGLLALLWRVVGHRRRMGDGLKPALIYAGSIIVTKYAQIIGLIRYWVQRRRGEFRLLEYK